MPNPVPCAVSVAEEVAVDVEVEVEVRVGFARVLVADDSCVGVVCCLSVPWNTHMHINIYIYIYKHTCTPPFVSCKHSITSGPYIFSVKQRPASQSGESTQSASTSQQPQQSIFTYSPRRRRKRRVNTINRIPLPRLPYHTNPPLRRKTLLTPQHRPRIIPPPGLHPHIDMVLLRLLGPVADARGAGILDTQVFTEIGQVEGFAGVEFAGGRGCC